MTWSQPCARASARLLVAARGADHRGAQVLGPLAGDQAHPAGGGVEQDGVAAPRSRMVWRSRYWAVIPFKHHRPRPVRSSISAGSGTRRVGGHHPLLAVGARPAPPCVGHPVAGLQARSRPGPPPPPRPAASCPGVNGSGSLYRPGPVVGVDEVQARRSGGGPAPRPGPGWPTATSSQRSTSGPPVRGRGSLSAWRVLPPRSVTQV